MCLFSHSLFLTQSTGNLTAIEFTTRSVITLFFHGATSPSRPRPPHYWGFKITLG
jgi:hypothetical protein